jgi:hypothetical protein
VVKEGFFIGNGEGLGYDIIRLLSKNLTLVGNRWSEEGRELVRIGLGWYVLCHL